MDVVALSRGHRSLARPPQLPLHGLLSEALSLAAAERLGLPQLPEGAEQQRCTHVPLFLSQRLLLAAVVVFQCRVSVKVLSHPAHLAVEGFS